MINQTNICSYLAFSIDKEQYAVPVGSVIEVLRNTELTSVPKTEEYIEGIINFRGEILTVVNTRLKLNLNVESTPKKFVIIVFDFVIDGREIRIGAIADKVKKVFEISESEIKPVPDFGSYYNPEFLRGAIKSADDSFMMILDVEKIFSSKEVEIIRKTAEHIDKKE